MGASICFAAADSGTQFTIMRFRFIRVVVGVDKEAFRWTATRGIEGLGFLAGGSVSSAAYGVSGDGKVIVGSSRSANSGTLREAFRWTSGGGMVGLGDLPGGNFSSFGIL